MESLSVWRRAQRRLAWSHSGVDQTFPRAFVAETESSLTEQQILALPVWGFTVLPVLQDPTTGQAYFVIDGSVIDGTDIIR